MKSDCNLADSHLIQSISVLFHHDEMLLEFFFHHKYPRPRLASKELLREAMALGPCQQVLIKVALDVWDGSGETSFNEILRVLDEENLIRVISLVSYFWEIPEDLVQVCDEL